MATLSPLKPRAKPISGPTPVHRAQSSPHRAALVPRSALPEPGPQNNTITSPNSASLSAAQVIQAFNIGDARDGAFLLSAKNFRQEFGCDAASMTSVSARSSRNSDEETRRGSSEASVDIITERDPFDFNDVRSASPRKPLPAQWLPPQRSPIFTTDQRTETRGDTENSVSHAPIDRRSVRATRSAITIGKAHAETTSFLTKEALDAVDANIASLTLRKSPSKIQRSPTKAPWNSPTAAQKLGSLRHSSRSPAKPSPPRTAHPNSHLTAHHRRATSSIVSAGGISYHTAHGSPVRSSAGYRSSFSSTEGLENTVFFHCSDDWTDVNFEQVDEPASKGMFAVTTASKSSNRSQSSRPELSIRIPPLSSALDAEYSSASTLASTSSSKSVQGETSQGHDQPEGHTGCATQSRIPRVSISKGSSAHAPTLSSTLKQTKSTQTLRSPKAMKTKTETKSPATSKPAGPRSLRHVRTIDSTGSTPILLDRKCRDLVGLANVADTSTMNSVRTTPVSQFSLMTSDLQDTVIQAPASAGDLPTSPTTSRVTSSSTVKASQIIGDALSSRSVGPYTCEIQDLSGNIHSSDADDENDDSSMSTVARGRSKQYSSSTHGAIVGEMSMQSGYASSLRPTATEFVPTRQDTSRNVALGEYSLPDIYTLDGFGVPWFYHVYPVPWMFPSTYTYTKPRSRSPKKFKPKKQRPTPEISATNQQIDSEANSAQIGSAASVDEWATTVKEQTGVYNALTYDHDSITTSKRPTTQPDSKVKASDGPFSAQLDMIAHQAALQIKTNASQSPEIDLTTIRNVPAQGESQKDHAYHNTAPYKRRNQRQVGNGLYGGHGNIGVPLHATAPFPMPVPPMGRRMEESGGGHNAYIGDTGGVQACGTINIERAAEYGGGQACNTCEPDH